MVWLAVTRPDMPRRIVSATITSTNREWSSSVSSQWMSTAQAVLVGQRHRELDRLDAVLAGQLVVRDAADHVGAELDGLAHQLPAAVEAEDALLRERDQLQVDQAARPPRAGRPARAAPRSSGSQTSTWLRTCWTPQASCQRSTCRTRACTSSTVRSCDPLGPDRDALEQRAGHVRPRLADGEHRVEVDVRLDQRRRDQPAVRGRWSRRASRRVDGDDPAVVDAEVGERVLAATRALRRIRSIMWPSSRITGGRTAAPGRRNPGRD